MAAKPPERKRQKDQAGTLSLRGPKKIYTASRAAASLRMGWDGWMGRGIKSVFQFFYTFYVYRVSKFDVKLGVVIQNFKNTAGN